MKNILSQSMARRGVLAVIPASVIALFLGDGASAADAPKLKCTKVGQSVIYRNKKFTCVKKNSKLVWNKGVPVKASASPKASASASATTSTPSTPTDQVKVAQSGDVAEGGSKVVTVSGKPVVLSRSGGNLTALNGACTHQNCAVEPSGKILVCPCHQSKFDWLTGAVKQGPATRALPKYEVSENAGAIYVKI